MQKSHHVCSIYAKKNIFQNMKESLLYKTKKRFGIIGKHKNLDRALRRAIQVAPTDLSILIVGENGTGKESFAQIIHYMSTMKHGELISVNCGAIPEGTMESELFGHEKGAFTGAVGQRKGYFEEANKGTLLLDEVGEIPLSSQPKLLRVLENKEFMRVGSSKKQHTETRVVAATHVDLMEAIKKEKFREDLYYRLAQVIIEVPPLRERGQDILDLFNYFTLSFASKYQTPLIKLDENAEKELLAYPFPGNIRQLKNIAWQIAALENQAPIITVDILSGYLPKTHHLPTLSNNSIPPLKNQAWLFGMVRELQEEVKKMKIFIGNFIKKNNEFSTICSIDEKKKIENGKKLRFPVGALPPSQKAKSEEKIGSWSLIAQEKRLIKKALEKYKYKKKAAEHLEISERTLYRKIKAYKIEDPLL